MRTRYSKDIYEYGDYTTHDSYTTFDKLGVYHIFIHNTNVVYLRYFYPSFKPR